MASTNTTQGKATPPQRPWYRPGRGWIAFFIVVLAFNFLFTMRATQPASRVRVPYSPFFLAQVRADRVASITSKGTAIQGVFTRKLSYQGSKLTEQFGTEVPAFANTD